MLYLDVMESTRNILEKTGREILGTFCSKNTNFVSFYNLF